jgi:transcriptional regulator with GAF, ATPase, and Fis domain
MQRLEQIAHLVRSSRNAFTTLDRALHTLTEVLGARGGAIVLSDASPKRQQEWACGDDQRQIIQMGRELVDGVEAHGEATARHTVLPGSRPGRTSEGMVLSTPLTGVQQAIGVMVFFCLKQPPVPLGTVLTCLNVVGTVLGCHLQTASLQERLKAQPDATSDAAAGLSASYNPDQIVGHSARMKAIMHEIQQAANSRSTILLRGESGTGKELVARGIHRLSHRAAAPFVAVNCGAIPDTLVESELFGSEEGAFTGAVSRPGCFERADGGTLFLDEVADMPLDTQVKLLRALENREVTRVGGRYPLEVNVRVVSATNRDIEAQVADGTIRADLLYRLAVLLIHVPPLRERREDIPLLAHALLRETMSRAGRIVAAVGVTLSDAALQRLATHTWPGNVRELRNVLERARLLARRRTGAQAPLLIDARDIVLDTALPRR